MVPKHSSNTPLSLVQILMKQMLLAYQILTNDDQMLILCLSHFITTVLNNFCLHLCLHLFSSLWTGIGYNIARFNGKGNLVERSWKDS